MLALVEKNPVAAVRDLAHQAEGKLRLHDPLDIPVTHYFSQGVYGRRMDCPKDSLVVGKIHKYQQLNVLLSGEVTVLTPDGAVRVKPPFVTVQPAGSKRVFYAHEDSAWLVVHGTEENDVEKIEAHFIAQSEAEYLEHCRLLELKENS